MATRKARQEPLFLKSDDLPLAPTLPLHVKLNQVLVEAGFDESFERVFRPFYADSVSVRQSPGDGVDESTPDHSPPRPSTAAAVCGFEAAAWRAVLGYLP